VGTPLATATTLIVLRTRHAGGVHGAGAWLVQAAASPGCWERQSGTSALGFGTGPRTRTRAPPARSRPTMSLSPVVHAGPYIVKWYPGP